MSFRCRSLLLVLLLGLCTGPAAQAQDSSVQTQPPPACGTQAITIARLQWPSAAILAHIHARLLATHFGCEVQVQEGDLAAVGSSMGATGQPAVAPELWIARIAEIWNAAIRAQEVRQVATAYVEPVLEGWFVPDYSVAEWPEITSIEGLRQRAPAFAPGGKGRFISCPPDWACSLINRNLLRANGLDTLFEIVEPANRFELDTLIAEAVSRREPILFYYWQPNAIMAQFEFSLVDLGPYDAEAFLCAGRQSCPTPTPTGFAPDPAVIALAEWVVQEAPQVAAYFQRASLPLAEMNAMLLQLSEAGETVESVADRFVAERSAVWGPWAGLAAQDLPLDAGSAAPSQ
jgi:glycine betaine/proline transport system substrate-binding protein